MHMQQIQNTLLVVTSRSEFCEWENSGKLAVKAHEEIP